MRITRISLGNYIPACRYKARYASIGWVTALKLQTVLHLRDSYCACPKMAESIGQWEQGIDELMQDSHEATNDTQRTSIGLRCRRKSYSIDESIGQV